MKKYIKPLSLVLFNNAFLLMIDTPKVYNHLWSSIIFALLWFMTFSMLVVSVRYTKLPDSNDK